MKYEIKSEKAFTITGPMITTSTEQGMNFKKIPMFWDEIMQDETYSILKDNLSEKGIMGVISNFNLATKTFDYYIAIEYKGQNLDYPKLNIPESTWVKFLGFGKLPEGIQDIFKRIPKWFEDHPEYIRLGHTELELYSGETDSSGNTGYEVWIPISDNEK